MLRHGWLSSRGVKEAMYLIDGPLRPNNCSLLLQYDPPLIVMMR